MFKKAMITASPRAVRILVAQALVAAGLVAALCLSVDLDQAITTIRYASPLPLAAALAMSMFGVLISAEKWRGLLQQAGIRLSLFASARLYWIGMFCSNFLPSSIGGDALRLLLTPVPGRRAVAVGTILVERLTGLLVMLALCTLGLVLRPQYFDAPGLREIFLAAVLVLALGVVAALLVPRQMASYLLQLAGRLSPSLRRPVELAARVAAAVASLTRSSLSLSRAMALSVCFYGTMILSQHAVLRAVEVSVPLSEVALVAAVVPLLTLLPLSLNGLGMAEGVFVLLYTQLGVAPEVALAAALLRRLVNLLSSSLGGLFWLASSSPAANPLHSARHATPVVYVAPPDALP